MGVGVSLVLIAVGAILTWAINASVQGVEVHTVGWILMIVGAVGLIITMFLVDNARWGGWKWEKKE